MLTTFAKATYATVFSALGALSGDLVGAKTFAAITTGQWVTVAIAALVAGGVVYGIPNTPNPDAAPVAVQPAPPIAAPGP